MLGSGQLAQGKRVREFEERFAEWWWRTPCRGRQFRHDGPMLPLFAHGIGPGDEVITTPFSFYRVRRTASSMPAQRRAFADIDPLYYGLDPASVEAQITPATKAIIRYIFSASRATWMRWRRSPIATTS